MRHLAQEPREDDWGGYSEMRVDIPIIKVT